MKLNWKLWMLIIQLIMGQLFPVRIMAEVHGENLLQQITVSGRVTSAMDGMALPGVTIIVKGSQKGAVSNADGHYEIEIPSGESVLIFSYIGYETREVNVGNQRVIDVALSESLQELEEVVVTALGIKREEKSLGYSVGKVKGEELTRVVQENVLNSMAGKVAGVTINSTGGTGSSVSMVIRGATSLNSDNQPLFVVDGVPISNTLNNIQEFGQDNRVDYGNAISDINPEDIENVSILKGPSAAALYGTRAGNGVVLITTKKAAQKSGLQVSISSNTVFDIPVRFLDVHSRFSTGYFPYTPEAVGSDSILPEIKPDVGAGAGIECDRGYWAVQWGSPVDSITGERLPIPVVSNPNNVRNFVNTGITTTNSVAISNNSGMASYRMGFTNMSNKGVVPGSDLFRNNFTLSASSKAWDKLTISTNVNYSHSWSNNRPATNNGANPLQWAYALPVNIDIRALEDIWVPGREGLEPIAVSSKHDNPYFLAHEVDNSFSRNRIFGNVEANWQLLPSFSLKGRIALDENSEMRETKMPPGYTREPNNGAYGVASIHRHERNMDVLATYKKDWENLQFTASAGANLRYTRYSRISNSSKNEVGLIVPNVFTLGNIKNSDLNYSSYWGQKAIYSVYGLATLGWKGMVYLDLTARNDWSSTLPVENRSYFYPSASLSLMVNEVLAMGPKVNMVKLRAGWAQVGNDTDPYSLYPVYGNAGQWGDAVRLSKSDRVYTPDLMPEEATSLEFGTDLKFLNNRIWLEATYYMVDNLNQILPNIPLAASTGYSYKKLNAGLLQSKGVELMLGGSPVSKGHWRWDLSLNLTRNRTRIMDLPEDVPMIEFWGKNKSYSYGFPNDPETGEDGMVGNIYSYRVQRVEDKNSPYYGYPIIADEGPIDYEWLPEEHTEKVGNYNPDFLMGLQTQLAYKGLSLSMTFDWRHGGQYMSQTFRYFAENNFTQTWLDNLVYPGASELGNELRAWVIDHEDELLFSEGFHSVGGPTAEYGGFPENLSTFMLNDGIFAPGVIGYHDEDGNFVLISENLGGAGTKIIPYAASYPWDFGTPAMFDADYIKLREISLSYMLPASFARKLGMASATVSVYSRNIILWTKDSVFGIDPERAFQAESGKGNRGTQFMQGIERYNVLPWVIPVGFKLGFVF
ncbi:MAG: SusC/RagA family TonB-linked outer membrane protein [Bacteroidota bacterium]